LSFFLDPYPLPAADLLLKSAAHKTALGRTAMERAIQFFPKLSGVGQEFIGQPC
jgi:hypothetical protein